MFINNELLKKCLTPYEYTIFLSKYGQENVEINLNFIKENSEIDWYNSLPEILDEDHHAEFTELIGPKLNLFNAEVMKLNFETKNNRENYDEKYFEMLDKFEFSIIEICLKLLNKQFENIINDK